MAEQCGKNQCQKIILASGSPRRRELLGAMGYEFAVLVLDYFKILRIRGEFVFTGCQAGNLVRLAIVHHLRDEERRYIGHLLEHFLTG